MPIKRLPLVAQPAQREFDTTIDANLRNALVEKDANGILWAYKRPAIQTANVPAMSGTPIGQTILQSTSGYSSLPLFITSTTAYWSTFSAALGSQQGVLGLATSVDGQFVVLHTLPVTGSSAYWQISHTSTSFTATPLTTPPTITAGSLPAYGLVQLDSTFYVMDSTGAIWGSNTNDPNTWSAANVIQANSAPGAGILLMRQLAYVMAFKEYDIEVFYDAANPTGSPLAPVPSARILYGTRHPYSVSQIDTRIIFVAQTLGGEVFVAMMDNLNSVKISTAAVDRILAYYTQQVNSGAAAITAACVKIMGHTLYLLKMVGGQSLCYDLDNKVWSEWDLNGFSSLMPSAIPSNGGSLIITDQGWFTLAAASAQDSASGAFTWSLTTPPFDGGTRNYKYISRMDILTDNTPAKELKVRWSDDDQVTWSNFRTVNLASHRPSLVNCGRFRRRTFQFVHDGPQALRLQAVDLHVEEGSI